MANPSKVRTQVVDTSKTTPEQFLSGAGAPPVRSEPPAPSPAPEPESQASEQPIPQVAAPSAKPAPADPFVLLTRAGSSDKVSRSIRAMSVPGGVIVKSSYAVNNSPVMGETLCFVPGVEVKDLQAALEQPLI